MLEPFEDCFGHVAQRGAFRRYLFGLLSDSRRKSMSAMLARVAHPGTYQAFHHFITDAPWSAETVWRKLRTAIPDRAGVLILDGTSFPKQGTQSVGVRARYRGTLGKVANCQVAVTVALWNGARAWMLGAALYLPEAWLTRAACTQARIPATVRFQEKWRLALTLLRQVRASGTATVGVPRNDRERRRDAERVRQVQTMQRAAQRGVVAELGIAQYRGHVEAGRADLPQQRERQRHFSWKRSVLGIRARCRASSVSHSWGIYNAAPSIHARTPVQSAAVTATWQLATLPSVPQYCRATATERRPCFGKLVPSRISTPLRSGITARSWRQTRSALHGRIGDEVLKRLIRARIADALEHRAHRLPATVAEQTDQIATKRAALRHVREADLERLEPLAQAIEPRRRVPRQSRQHRVAAYRTPRASTSPLSQFRLNSGANSWI